MTRLILLHRVRQEDPETHKEPTPALLHCPWPANGPRFTCAVTAGLVSRAPSLFTPSASQARPKAYQAQPFRRPESMPARPSRRGAVRSRQRPCVAPKPLLRALAVAQELLFFLLQSHERARLDGNELRLAQDLRQVALFTVDQTSLPPSLVSCSLRAP